MKETPLDSTLCAAFPRHTKALIMLIVFIFAGSLHGHAQCNGYMDVYSYGGCGNSKTIQVYEYDGYASYFILYQKTSSGYWQYLDESPSDYGAASFSVYVTATTTFGISYVNENYWCESPKQEIIVSPSSPPYAWGTGYSCEYGTAYIQAQGTSGMSSFVLYEYENGIYQYIQSSSTGNFTLYDFYTDDTNYSSNYYVRGSKNGCWSNYSHVSIDVMRPAMPTVSGNTNPCYNTSTTLTASGGYEGSYRWYQGSTLISGATGSQYTTGNLTASTTYYVSYVAYGSYAECESPKRPVTVTVNNPSAPTPLSKTRCGPGNVTLSTNNSSFAEYQWYNQNGTLLGSTTSNAFPVSATGLSSYTVKVRNGSCWSGMSSSAAVTTTHNEPPTVYQGAACGSGTQVTMYASYYGERSGNYEIEWYTSATSPYPEYSATVNQYENDATYSPYLTGNKDYWIAVYDPGTSYDCRTERTHFVATVGTAPYAWGSGYSCEYTTAYIQAGSSSSISTYYLYRYENTGSGYTYNLIQSNSTGAFTVNDFYSDDTQYTSNYYIRGRSTAGCWSSYSNVSIEVMRPAMPTVTGNVNPCYNTSTTLTASGGYEGGYRWYEGSNLIPGVTGSQYTTGNLTASTTYYVSYIVEGAYGQCESPKRPVTVTVNNPSAPTPLSKTRCGPGNVTLSTNNSSFAEYQWYNQNGTLLGSTTSNAFPVSATGLTSYTVKVRNGSCWSGMSSSAAVTTTHNEPPTVYQGAACGSGTQVTMYASYYGERSGNYEIEWYTSATGTYPEYSATVNQYENDATYSPYLTSDKEYWIAVYDPGTSYDCRTERTHFVATVGTAPYVWGSGYSCEYNTAHVQAQGSSAISTYYLYKYEDNGTGLTYNLIDNNSSGIFTINDFYSDDTQYVSNYYVRGRSAQGCWSSYSNVSIDVLRPAKPSVVGNLQPCYNSNAILTASGGYEGAYRWYEGTNLLPGETGSVYTSGQLTTATTYYVSYVDEGMYGGQCESPKEKISVTITPLPEKPSTMNPTVRRCGTGTITLEVWGHYNDFQWYDANDNAISGATLAAQSVQLDQLNDEQLFKVRGISAEGCQSELTVLSATAVSECENYIHDRIIHVRGVTSETQLAALTAEEKADTWNYLDGLGRPKQAIVMEASPELKDMVKVFEYDELGREAKSILSYSASQSNGQYRSTAKAEILSYYQNRFADDNPQAVTKFMDSPLSRLAEQGGVGSSWQPNQTTPENGKTKKFIYGTNDSETVLRWTITSAYNSETVSISSSSYPANTLEESTLVDDANPDHLKSVTYKDFLGNTILQKEQIDATEWAETYYVYDEFGQLRVVLPPQAVWTIKNQGLTTVSGTLLNDYAFLYLYDDEGRKIAEKSPGASWVYNVFDRVGQLVLRQDGNQRLGNQWTFHKYDVLGRPVLSGLITLTGTVEQIRADVENHTVTFEDRGTTVLHYTNNAYPSVTDPNAYLKAVYYDDIKTVPEAYSDLPAQSNLPASVLLEMDKTESNKDLVTHSKSRILGTNEWMETSYFYDRYHNNVYTVTKETSSGSRFIRYQVENHHDPVSNELEKQITTASTGEDQIGLVKRFEYDHGGRIEKEYYGIVGEGTEPEVLGASYEYNELGQLVSKKIHSEDGGATWLQAQDYKYNLQGALTSLNSLTGNAGDTDYFGFDMAFDNTVPNAGNTPRYDGMISAMRWNDDLTEKENLYNFDYDGLNRLTSSTYKKGSTGVWTDQNKYSEDNLSYDLNGNIKSLRRYQGNGLSSTDNLTYDYGSGGNQLKSVSDNASEPELGFADGNTSGDDYAYDENGNLLFDLNKTITAITYNHLNLPAEVTFATPSQTTPETIKFIRYAYNSDGAKLRHTYVNTVEEELFTISYIGEFVAVDGEFHSVLTPQGRVVAPSYTNLISNREANSLEGFTANQNVTISSVYQNDETYVKVVSDQSGSTPGVFPIGGTIAVKEGERYALKVLGYRETTDNAFLYVRGNTSNIVWTGALLPEGQLNEGNARTEFTIPPGVTQISVGVLWENPSTGATFYINRVALYKLDWEYQYFLTDHLGSPRVVLGSDESVIDHAATFESESQPTEAGKFLNVQYANVVPHTLANATPGGNEVIRLNNTYRVGPSKSFKVFPGDKIDASVYAYYDGVSGMSQTPVTTMAAAVFSAMGNGVSAVDGAITAAYNNSASSVPGFLLSTFQGTDRPSAFINYILFDQDFIPIEAKSVPVGSSPNTLHQIAIPQIEVKELGHLFIYLSYDNESSSWVHFDEFKITYTESPVIQVNAYYPYGMLAYSWTRDGEDETREKFQGKEYDEKTGWHDFHARQYDASLGRWFSPDPANQFTNPYMALLNNPTVYTDPDGRIIPLVVFLGAAVIGGGLNLISNSDNIDNPWQALGYFVAGAASGALSPLGPAGWAAGGMITGASNAALSGADPGTIVHSGLVGGISGLVGGAAGQIGGKFGGLVINSLKVNSPMLSGAISGALGGALGGFAGGATGGFLTGQNPWQAGLAGAKTGAVIGAATGAGAAGVQAHKNGYHPLTGRDRHDIVYRALRPDELTAVSQRRGLSAKNPDGTWTLEEHLKYGSRRESFRNDPWISTTRDYDVATGFGPHRSIVRIALNEVYSPWRAGWRYLPRSSSAYHFSLWQNEVSIYRHVPQNAIKSTLIPPVRINLWNR